MRLPKTNSSTTRSDELLEKNRFSVIAVDKEEECCEKNCSVMFCVQKERGKHFIHKSKCVCESISKNKGPQDAF